MLNALKLFFQPSLKHEAHAAYVQLVEQARNPWFYENQAVPDTLDGRFDVIILHIFLLVHRLRREQSDNAALFVRAVSEVFFADMDRSLREMGVGDTGISHRIKKMVSAFYGRLQAYEQSVINPEQFRQSLQRNLYRETPVESKNLQELDDYIRRNIAHLDQQITANILKGELTFLR
jgi:cytochrome b pre-mRNA-processing protein 3